MTMQKMTLDEVYAEYGKLSLAYSQIATENYRLKQQIASMTVGNKAPSAGDNGDRIPETAPAAAL